MTDVPVTGAHLNLFPGALPHVKGWAKGRLEDRSEAIYSSQALCVSVFGAIASGPQRSQILQDVLREAGVGLHPEGEPVVECEVRGRREVLKEYGGQNPTCPDVLVTWADALITVESKFTEHLGGCSQTKPKTVKRDGAKLKLPPACRGDHAPGSDTRTRTIAACRLTIPEGDRTPRLYWEVAATLFTAETLHIPRDPCPFRDGAYQLMRNVCFAAHLSQMQRQRQFGFLLTYVESAASAVETRRSFNDFQVMLLPEIRPRVGAISYEAIGRVLRRHHEEELASWLDRRIPDGIAARATGRPRPTT